MQEEPKYLTIPGYAPIKQAAKMLGLSEERVLQYVRKGMLPSEKVGGRYLVPLHSLDAFQRKPHGRLRSGPVAWRPYSTPERVFLLQLEADVRAGQEARLHEQLAQLPKLQRHVFAGTMQRYVSLRGENPTQLAFILVWRASELDESRLQHDLEALKTEFARYVEWDTARIQRLPILIHTLGSTGKGKPSSSRKREQGHVEEAGGEQA
jgi:excisionase family DNA binding protein